MTTRIVKLLLLCALLMIFTANSWAQGAATAELHVTVKDPNGALVKNATVVVSNDGPHKARSITVGDPFGTEWTDLSCAADHAGVCRPYRYGYLVTFASLASGDAATITFGNGGYQHLHRLATNR